MRSTRFVRRSFAIVASVLCFAALLGCEKAPVDEAPTEAVDAPFVEHLVFVYRVPAEQRVAVEEALGKRLDAMGIAYRLEPGGVDTVTILMPEAALATRTHLEAELGRRGILRFMPVADGPTRALLDALQASGSPANVAIVPVGQSVALEMASGERDPIDALSELLSPHRGALPGGHRLVFERLSSGAGGQRGRALVVAEEGAILDVKLTAAEAGEGEWGAYARVTLSEEHAEAFHTLTKAQLERPVVMLVDDRVLSVPVVRTPIPGGVAEISLGSESPGGGLAEARMLAAVLSSIALPSEIELMAVIDPQHVR